MANEKTPGQIADEILLLKEEREQKYEEGPQYIRVLALKRAEKNLRQMSKGNFFGPYLKNLFRYQASPWLYVFGVREDSHKFSEITKEEGLKDEEWQLFFWLRICSDGELIIIQTKPFSNGRVKLADIPEKIWIEIERVLNVLSEPKSAAEFLIEKFGV